MTSSADFKPAIHPIGEEDPPLPGPRVSWIPLTKHGDCFVCQEENDGGLKADLYLDGNIVRCPFTFRRAQHGPPGHAHGGSIAALLDELMGATSWLRRHNAVAAHLEFDYRRPTPLGTEVIASAWARSDGNRSMRVASEIRLPDGSIAVQGCGIFVIAPSIFENGYAAWRLQEPGGEEA